ncbi:MAG: aminodeoxychorismate lyase [Gammaproteobacteria bacterium]|nr:aminodeoxychorismate lyase [Gammaproteobacteria bacterium]MBU1733424.1 aminodeoxychorismate lyase [Gammaproteobacteria bacterium]MBU1891841.1 aminodeoxychorismate lyase [Gammaproteobacteria bacterium]
MDFMTLIDGIPSDVVSANDRGLLYGDGVFRTLKREGGGSRCWARQYAKLSADCAALNLRCPDSAILATELAQLPPDCVAKIIVTRGPGARGYAVSGDAGPRRIVTASALPDYPSSHYMNGVKVRLCGLRLGSQPRLAGVKHLNRLENVLARMEWKDAAIAEGLLLDEAGNVIEGTMSNVFSCRAGVLHTPDLGRCGVAGVQRDRILDFAAELGLATHVAPLALDELMAADEVMLCNSVIGLWQVREFNGRVWNGGAVSARLRSLLEDRDD